MENISRYIGAKIKMLRQLSHISSKVLAERIGKSGATISKYEAGSVTMDINILYKIARVLRVPLSELTSFPEEVTDYEFENELKLKNKLKSKNESGCENPNEWKKDNDESENYKYANNKELFLYYHDNSRNVIVKGHMILAKRPGQAVVDAYLYSGIPSMAAFERGSYAYHGSMEAYNFITYFYLKNPVNSADRIMICSLNPLHQHNTTYGILTGLNANPLAPYSSKVLIATTILSKEQLEAEALELSKEEMNTLRKNQIMYIRNEK